MSARLPPWLSRVDDKALSKRVACLCFVLAPGVEGIISRGACLGSNGVIVIQSSTGPRPRRIVLHRLNLGADKAWPCRQLLRQESTPQSVAAFAELVRAHQKVEPGARWHDWATPFDEFGRFEDYDRTEKPTFIDGLERHAEIAKVRAVLNIFDPPDLLVSRERVAMGPTTLARHQCALRPAVFCNDAQEWVVRWQLVGDLVLMYGNDAAQTIRSVEDNENEGEVQRKRRECDSAKTFPEEPIRGFTVRMDEHLFLSLRFRQKMWHQKRLLAKDTLIEDAMREEEHIYRELFAKAANRLAQTPDEFGAVICIYEAQDERAAQDAAAEILDIEAKARETADAELAVHTEHGRPRLGALDRLVLQICDAKKLEKSVEHRALLGTLHAGDIPPCLGLREDGALDHTYETRKRIFCTRTHLEKEGYSQLERHLSHLVESFYDTKDWPDRKKQVLAPMRTLYRAPSCASCPFGYATPDQCLVGEADFTRFYTPADVIIDNAQARKDAEAEDDDEAATDALMAAITLDQPYLDW